MTPADADDAVTLQVNVAPIDLPHADATLRHQLRRWSPQVARVVYSLDLRKSPGPRGAGFEQRKQGIERLLERLAAESPTTTVVAVDYRPAAVQHVADMFFGGATPPSKDCYGAPFYGYFHGLASVETRYVLHVDCDMLFGGGSGAWLREAIELLSARPEALFVSPLPGPPTVDGRIARRVRRRQRRTQRFGSEPVLERRDPRTYVLRHVGTRVFFADLDRLRAAGPLKVLDAPPWSRGSNLATSPFLPAETTLSQAMHQAGRVRLDYLGTEPGMWFVHPDQRGAAFVANLPNVIDAIETGTVPDCQRGSGGLRGEWIDAVGPERLDRAPFSVRRAIRAVARATGALRARDAVWRVWWRWHHRMPV